MFLAKTSERMCLVPNSTCSSPADEALQVNWSYELNSIRRDFNVCNSAIEPK